MLLLLLAALALASCSSDSAADQRATSAFLASVPAEAIFISEVRPQDIAGNAALEIVLDAFARVNPASLSLDATIHSLEQSTGLSAQSIQSYGFFSFGAWMTRPATGWPALSSGAALVLAPSYDRVRVRAAVERDYGALTADSYAREQLFSNAEENVALVFLGRDQFAVGSPRHVQALLDVRQGSRTRLRGKIRDTFLALDSRPLRVAAQPPPGEMLETFSRFRDGKNLAGAAVDFTDLWTAQRFALSMGSPDGGASVQWFMEYASSAGTSQAATRLGGTVSLLKAFSGSREINSVFNKIRVSGNGRTMTVSLRLTPAELEHLPAMSSLLAPSLLER